MNTITSLLHPQYQINPDGFSFWNGLVEDIIQSDKLENSPCIYDLSHLGIIHAAGKDAANFLQGQLTCNIHHLKPQEAQPAACCDLQGRIICLFWVIPWQEGYCLILPQSMKAAVLKHFKKYALFSKVSFNADPPFVLCGFSSPSNHLSQTLFECFEGKYMALIPTENASSVFLSVSENHYPLGSAAWHYQQIKKSFPNIYPQTQGKFLPHDLNLHQLQFLDFEKGCYLGQEIIARMHYRAVLKYQVSLFIVSSKPQPGNSIFIPETQEIIGEVVDVSPASEQTFLLLVSIKKAALENLPVSVCLGESRQPQIMTLYECP